jgi:cobalt-zinc-cadmium efflux system membrane fusion protein
MKSKTRVAFAALLGLALLLAACNNDKSPADRMTSYSSSDTGPRPQLFTVPPEQMAHVQVLTVEPASMQRVLRLPGQVAYNQFRTTPVITQVNGPVARILVAPGENVKAGAVLAYISSPDYAAARATYLKAKAAFQVADKNYARAQDLYAHHAIAERDLLQAESDRTQAQADLQNSEQALRVMGVQNFDALDKGPATPELPVLAPIGGEVVERLVSPGQVVQAGQTQCFTISDMSAVWVLVNVYQNDLAYVRNGEPVTIETDAYPDRFQGKISYVGAALNPDTRTLQARIVTANPGEKLKKDMYVTALVRAGEFQNALAVPDSAILHDAENHPFVYVASAGKANQFEQRLVTLGQAAEGRTQITAGLQPGERVVGNGSLFLQFENSLQR